MTNEVLEAEDFYISYQGNYGLNETAICIPDATKIFGTRYLILEGDHLEAYRQFDGDLEKCKQYFLDHRAIQSKWTDKP